MILLRPICWLETFAYTFMRWMGQGQDNMIIHGHRYVEQASYEADGRVYEPLLCVRCGHISTDWRELDSTRKQTGGDE